MKLRVLVVGLWLVSGCVSKDDFSKMVADAAQCSANDTCAVASPPTNGCTCFQVVRSAEVTNIEAAARQVACGGMVAKCVTWTNPRCEAGACVADQAH